MQLVMLSGNSLRNRDWIYEARDRFSGLVDETYIQNYQHWQTGEQWIDLPHELEVLKQQKLSRDYGVFAKSIGTVLATQAIEKGIINPKFLLFCGIPLDYIAEEYTQFAQILANSGLPLVVIHNENDKVGSAEAVREYLLNSLADSNLTFIETPGNTHDYEDYRLLRQRLSEMIKL